MTNATEPHAPVVTEILPAVQGEVSAIASANAPLIFFDAAVSFGFGNGIGNVTLEAVRFMLVNGRQVSDRMIVAHLRIPVHALASLKAAVDGMVLQSMPVENPEGKAN